MEGIVLLKYLIGARYKYSAYGALNQYTETMISKPGERAIFTGRDQSVVNYL